MEEEYTRRKQTRPPAASKLSIMIVILLLLVNTLALSLLLFLNVQASTKQKEQLDNIEKQVRKLGEEATAASQPTASTERNVPARESSTQATSTSTSSSTIESTTQPTQTPPSSEQSLGATEPSTAPVPTTYTVQSGDTLSVIAERNGLSLQSLMAKNNLTDPTVYIGQVLSLQ